MRKNLSVMSQIQNNTRDQDKLGCFEKPMVDLILAINDVHKKQMDRILSVPDSEKIEDVCMNYWLGSDLKLVI